MAANEEPRTPEAGPGPSPPSMDEHARQANQWAMFVHFSIVAGFVIPVAGLLLPIVLWQLKKDEFPAVDAHGKTVANWLLSAIVYFLLCLALAMVVGLFGFALLTVALSLSTLGFAIVGGIKANEGESWEYPLSIQFLK